MDALIRLGEFLLSTVVGGGLLKLYQVFWRDRKEKRKGRKDDLEWSGDHYRQMIEDERNARLEEHRIRLEVEQAVREERKVCDGLRGRLSRMEEAYDNLKVRLERNAAANIMKGRAQCYPESPPEAVLPQASSPAPTPESTES